MRRWSNMSAFRTIWAKSYSSTSRNESKQSILALNSLTGKLDSFPTSNGALKWYVCGPTVYDSAHLGHARSYVSQDILRRILTNHFRLDIVLVMGMTDVDDKIIASAAKQGISMEKLARHHEKAFLDDLTALNVLRVSSITRVSEHIPEIIEYIQGLEANGFAYATSDGVYFDTVALGCEYGKLAPSSSQEYEDATQEDNVIGKEKKNFRDFALWKFSKTTEEPGWLSPWGRGRPGWHIECSAMTHHVLGGNIDVHSGGIDLQFPHHNNEIAQCDGYHHHTPGHTWCKHFVHFGHLYIKGLKMSKSLKNFITIQSLLENYSADAFRLFCLQYKYNVNVHFSEDRMRDAVTVLEKVNSFLQTVNSNVKSAEEVANASKRVNDDDLMLLKLITDCKLAVDEALGHDFDTPTALNHAMDLITATNKEMHSRVNIPSEVLCAVATYVIDFFALFGIDSFNFPALRLPSSPIGKNDSSERSIHESQVMDIFAQFRAQVRQMALSNPSDPQSQRILDLCDQVRNKTLPPLGIQLEDVASGKSFWKHQTFNPSLKPNETEAMDQVKTILTMKAAEHEAEMQIKPSNYFRDSVHYAGKYTQFDHDGIPTHDDKDQELTKSMRKKLSDMWKSLKGLDAYPKTMEEFKVRTTQGGMISLCAMVLIVVLIVSELNFHLTVDTVDKMYVDGERNVNVLINFDIEFPKMPCSIISVEHGDMQGRVHMDVIDNIHKIRLDTEGNSLGEMVKHEMGNSLKHEDIKNHADTGYFCGTCYAAGEPGDCCNTCDDVKNAYARKNWALPSLHSISQCMNDELEGILNGTVNEGCRVFGHLVVAKVAGKFYFAPSRIFENGYLLDTDMLDLTFRSFDNTHKIKTLTFGSEYPNMKNPLNLRNKTLPDGQRGAYQYFLKVVSTDYYYLNGDEIKSNQYSVTEHFLQMTPTGHKGLPRVSFAYDFSPIKFRIDQTQKGLFPFFTSICAIVGGVFTVMGLVDSAMHQLSTKTIKKSSLL